MKIAVVLLVVVALLASAFGQTTKGTTRPALKKKPCIKECGEVYKPVCGGDGSGKGNKSFGSECVLANYNCETESKLKVVSQGECPGGGGIRLQ